jgi:hypothetical protein
VRRALIATALLVLCSTFIGATVFRGQVAHAAQAILQVRVMNTAAEAVPVREQANLQPVQALQFGTFSTDQRFSSEETLYTVPASKTLVIEGFSLISNQSATDVVKDARLTVETGTESFSWFLQPADEGVFSGTGARIFRGSDQLRAYAGPGTTVVAEAVRDGTSLSSTSVGFYISGHLVDTP